MWEEDVEGGAKKDQTKEKEQRFAYIRTKKRDVLPAGSLFSCRQ
jgi:hypothetical protein